MSTGSSVDRDRARAVAVAAQHHAERRGIALPPELRLWRLVSPDGPTPASCVDDRRPAGRPSRLRGEAGDFAAGRLAGDVAPTPAANGAAGGPSGGPMDQSGGHGQDHDDLARVLEAATPAADRQAKGLHVTPDWLADHLIGLALDDLAAEVGELMVCDPACGGGAFLLAAARALHARGADRADVVRRLLWGADIDPVGLATAEAALALWAGEPPPPGHLVVGDALLDGPAVWPQFPAPGFGVVVGNPPFLNQLGRATVRPRNDVQRLRDRYGPTVRPYTDTAWLFMLLAVELARPGGRVVLVQPLSLVGARDAGAVRSVLDDRAELRELWVEQQRTFAASVQVCAPVLAVRAGGGTVVPARWPTDPARPATPAGRTASGPSGQAGPDAWAERLADALGIPRIERRSTGGGAAAVGAGGAARHERRGTGGGAAAVGAGGAVGRERRGTGGGAPSSTNGRSGATGYLGERAAVTAGFRDEYYGLVPLVREARGHAGERPLVTVGVLDWGRSRWGDRPTQFAKRRWIAPVVDVGRADPQDESPAARGGARWIERMSVPKVVVATQTRVVEAAVDESGAWVPSVPALVVLPHQPEELWLLAAAVAAPTSTVWLFRRAPGTALSRGALKVAARDLAELPLPTDPTAWGEAADALRAYATAPTPSPGLFEAFVVAAAGAYGAEDALVSWWRSRLPAVLGKETSA